MADPKHVDVLRQSSVVAWGDWRMRNSVNAPDLSGANLSNTNLNLNAMNLSGANLSGANLTSKARTPASLNPPQPFPITRTTAAIANDLITGLTLTMTTISPVTFLATFLSCPGNPYKRLKTAACSQLNGCGTTPRTPPASRASPAADINNGCLDAGSLGRILHLNQQTNGSVGIGSNPSVVLGLARTASTKSSRSFSSVTGSFLK